MDGKIRVMVADDQAGRAELAALVAAQDDMEVVAELSDGADVLPKVVTLEPDVLLFDLGMTGGGLRALEQIAAARPQTRVLVLAMHEEISLLRSVLAFGSLGYVVHRGSRIEILSVIRKVHRGRGYVDVPTGGLHFDPGIHPKSEKRRRLEEKLEQLSKRELEVLKAVAYGFTNREIAERIGISVKSIETYRYRVAEKLGFQSRAELVRFALEAGLLQTGHEGLPQTE